MLAGGPHDAPRLALLVANAPGKVPPPDRVHPHLAACPAHRCPPGQLVPSVSRCNVTRRGREPSCHPVPSSPLSVPGTHSSPRTPSRYLASPRPPCRTASSPAGGQQRSLGQHGKAGRTVPTGSEGRTSSPAASAQHLPTFHAPPSPSSPTPSPSPFPPSWSKRTVPSGSRVQGSLNPHRRPPHRQQSRRNLLPRTCIRPGRPFNVDFQHTAIFTSVISRLFHGENMPNGGKYGDLNCHLRGPVKRSTIVSSSRTPKGRIMMQYTVEAHELQSRIYAADLTAEKQE